MMKKNGIGVFSSPVRAKVSFLEETDPKYK